MGEYHPEACSEYTLSILQAIIELDERNSRITLSPLDSRFSYSSLDFKDRVFELMGSRLGKADTEQYPHTEGKQQQQTWWKQARSQLSAMQNATKERPNPLLEVVEKIDECGKKHKGRYRITDAGVRYFNRYKSPR